MSGFESKWLVLEGIFWGGLQRMVGIETFCLSAESGRQDKQTDVATLGDPVPKAK